MTLTRMRLNKLSRYLIYLYSNYLILWPKFIYSKVFGHKYDNYSLI